MNVAGWRSITMPLKYAKGRVSQGQPQPTTVSAHVTGSESINAMVVAGSI
jgi:hypothetical protein